MQKLKIEKLRAIATIPKDAGAGAAFNVRTLCMGWKRRSASRHDPRYGQTGSFELFAQCRDRSEGFGPPAERERRDRVL